MYSNLVMTDLISAFNLWLATPAAPKGGEAVINYLFDFAHMSPDEQDKERARWIDTVEKGHKMKLADMDAEAAEAKTKKQDELAKVQNLRTRLAEAKATDEAAPTAAAKNKAKE